MMTLCTDEMIIIWAPSSSPQASPMVMSLQVYDAHTVPAGMYGTNCNA